MGSLLNRSPRWYQDCPLRGQRICSGLAVARGVSAHRVGLMRPGIPVARSAAHMVKGSPAGGLAHRVASMMPGLPVERPKGLQRPGGRPWVSRSSGRPHGVSIDNFCQKLLLTIIYNCLHLFQCSPGFRKCPIYFGQSLPCCLWCLVFNSHAQFGTSQRRVF